MIKKSTINKEDSDSGQNTNTEARVYLIDVLLSEIPIQEWFGRQWQLIMLCLVLGMGFSNRVHYL